MIEPIKQEDVLDKGWIKLIGTYGDERECTFDGRQSTDQDPDRNRDLFLRAAIRKGHWSVFEGAFLKLQVKAPIFVFRQWVRHKSWSFNEYSQRYSEAPCEFYDKISIDSGTMTFADLNESAVFQYGGAIAYGASREDARICLPVSQYTTFTASARLRDALFFCKARTSLHAQHQIRAYADVVAKWIEEWVPNIWSAFKEFHIDPPQVSAKVWDWIRAWVLEDVPMTARGDVPVGWTVSNTEWRELRDFLQSRG